MPTSVTFSIYLSITKFLKIIIPINFMKINLFSVFFQSYYKTMHLCQLFQLLSHIIIK